MRTSGRLILLLAIFSCSCTKTLSRGQAQQLISKHLNLPAAQTTRISKVALDYVMAVSNPDCGVTVCNYLGDKFADLKPAYFELERKGLVTFAPWSETEKCCFYVYTKTKLTDKGKPFLVSESNEAYLVRTHTLAFGEITGIRSMEQQKVAQVDYTLTVQDVTLFAASAESGTVARTASFSLFDDGWRIQ